MKVTIQAIHFKAADRLKAYIQEKVDKLPQFFDRIISAEVTLKVQNEHKGENKYMEITVQVPGQTLVASENAATFEAATDIVTDKMKAQLRKYKGKLKTHV